MTTVLIAVARSVSIFFIPILAKMAVNAAKNADNKAYIHHMLYSFY
jgi:Cu/Ag efflux pump CusA